MEKDLLITAGYVGITWVGMGIIVASWLAIAAAIESPVCRSRAHNTALRLGFVTHSKMCA